MSEKLEEGWYWVLANVPDAEWEPGRHQYTDDHGWEIETMEAYGLPVDDFEIGPRIHPPADKGE